MVWSLWLCCLFMHWSKKCLLNFYSMPSAAVDAGDAAVGEKTDKNPHPHGSEEHKGHETLYFQY